MHNIYAIKYLLYLNYISAYYIRYIVRHTYTWQTTLNIDYTSIYNLFQTIS